MLETPNGARFHCNHSCLSAMPIPVGKKINFADPEPHTTQTTSGPSENCVEDKTTYTNITKPIPQRNNNQQGPLWTKLGRTIWTLHIYLKL